MLNPFKPIMSKKVQWCFWHMKCLMFILLGLPYKVGMSPLIDHSGRLHTRKRATIKDIVVNREVGYWPNKRTLRTNAMQHLVTNVSESLSNMFIVWPAPTCFKVVLAAIKGNCGKPRLSAYAFQSGILEYFTKHRLFPSGVVAEIPSVRDWALRNAMAVKKLDSWLCHTTSFCHAMYIEIRFDSRSKDAQTLFGPLMLCKNVYMYTCMGWCTYVDVFVYM